MRNEVMGKESTLQIYATNSRRILSCYFYNFLELLSVKIKLFERILSSWRIPVFLKEIEMAKVTQKDKVLLIGCGIFPSETVLISETTKARTIGIDNSINAVKLAKNYVQKKELADLVTIQYADGVDIQLDTFDVIFIAINVFPIDDVLKHVASSMNDTARIMCKSLNNDIPDVLKRTGLSQMLTIEKKIENPKTQSFLLIKR